MITLSHGQIVSVFHDPMTQDKFEGKAVLISRKHEDPEQEYWRLVFLDDTEYDSDTDRISVKGAPCHYRWIDRTIRH